MDAVTVNYLRSLFARYYREHGSRLLLPSDFASREFAAQLWGMKSYVRHLSFKTRVEVERWAASKAPRHFYYSSAVYTNPEAKDMDEKGWVGADLTFDIDADHLPGCEDKIVRVEDKEREIDASFAPAECVERAAWEALKLYDILTYELGFEKSSVSIEFSGHRGFHVTVRCRERPECFTAPSEVRKEIVEYVRATGLEASLTVDIEVGSGRRRRLARVPPLAWEGGGRGRIARIIVRLAKREGNARIARILSMRNPVEAAFEAVSVWDQIEDYIQRALVEASVEVDVQVTVDTKRLVRIPYSLHGKTGLLVKPVTPNELEKFSLGEELSPFHRMGDARIRALIDTPKVDVMGHVVRLKAGEVYRLPLHVAVYLMCKGVAVLAR